MRPSLLATLAAAAATLLLPVILPAAAETAQTESRENYLLFKPGVFSPKSGYLSDNDSDRGFAAEMAYGHTLSPRFALETGLGYIWVEGDQDFTLIPVTLTAKGMFSTGRVAPYVAAGVGITFVEEKTTFFGGETDSDWAPQLHVGLGVNFHLAPRFFLGLEGRYIFLEASTFGQDKRLDGLAWTLDFGIRF